MFHVKRVCRPVYPPFFSDFSISDFVFTLLHTHSIATKYDGRSKRPRALARCYRGLMGGIQRFPSWGADAMNLGDQPKPSLASCFNQPTSTAPIYSPSLFLAIEACSSQASVTSALLSSLEARDAQFLEPTAFVSRSVVAAGLHCPLHSQLQRASYLFMFSERIDPTS